MLSYPFTHKPFAAKCKFIIFKLIIMRLKLGLILNQLIILDMLALHYSII